MIASSSILNCGVINVAFYANGNSIPKGSGFSYSGLFTDADDGAPNPSFRTNQVSDVSLIQVWDITYVVSLQSYPSVTTTSDNTEKF